MGYTNKQKEYIVNATHRWNIKSGAVRSGKSFVDVTFIVPMRIRERIGKDGLCFIIGVSKETIERNVLQPMRERYTSDVVGTINSRNIAKICGEDVYCLGAEKVSQVAKIQGASAKYIYGDEVAKWNEDVFAMLKSRLDKPYSCFDGSLNPEHPTHRLILGKWVRAEGAIYRKFADNPKAYYCKLVDRIDPDLPYKQILKSTLQEITIGIDFGGNKSGHAFVATGTTNNYSELVAIRSIRHFGEYDSNDLDRLAIEFAQSVFDMVGKVDYVYWDNAETVLGRGIKRAFEKHFPNTIVRPARKKPIQDRIQCALRLMGADRFFITDSCDSLKMALCEAVWNDKKLNDERLDDGSTDIDSLDSFEYTFERNMKRFIKVG